VAVSAIRNRWSEKSFGELLLDDSIFAILDITDRSFKVID
jgi:hypothetical protein